MAKTLTKSQRAILQFIVKFTQENGYPPSIREIQRGIGVIKSLRGITNPYPSSGVPTSLRR